MRHPPRLPHPSALRRLHSLRLLLFRNGTTGAPKRSCGALLAMSRGTMGLTIHVRQLHANSLLLPSTLLRIPHTSSSFLPAHLPLHHNKKFEVLSGMYQDFRPLPFLARPHIRLRQGNLVWALWYTRDYCNRIAIEGCLTLTLMVPSNSGRKYFNVAYCRGWPVLAAGSSRSPSAINLRLHAPLFLL